MLPTLLRRLRAAHAHRTRGQSLVEFALTLPVILLLTLVALDFGRVYLGYINVQNMARIAANYAANNPDAWTASSNPTIQAKRLALQTKYKNQILSDASASNCRLPQVGGASTVPPPSFTDENSDGAANTLGDRVTVQISCTFDVITPGIANILGGHVAVTAESNFPVKAGMSYVDDATSGGGAPILPNAAFTGNGILSSQTAGAVAISDANPYTVEFRDTSGGVPNAWLWDFGDGTTSMLEDPLDHTFSCPAPPCTFQVTLTASNANGSSKAYMDVTTLDGSLVAFAADKTLIKPNTIVNFTDKSTPGGTKFGWDFDNDGSIDSTVENPSHAYTATGTYSVTLTVDYPSPTGQTSLTKTSYISVQVGLCTVPSLTTLRFNDADPVFRGAPYNFTGHVVRDTGAPSGNFLILIQSLTATSLAPCDSDIAVTTP
jgi:PKD repeat protein/Flp pilus assembly protein TadG